MRLLAAGFFVMLASGPVVADQPMTAEEVGHLATLSRKLVECSDVFYATEDVATRLGFPNESTLSHRIGVDAMTAASWLLRQAIEHGQAIERAQRKDGNKE